MSRRPSPENQSTFRIGGGGDNPGPGQFDGAQGGDAMPGSGNPRSRVVNVPRKPRPEPQAVPPTATPETPR